MIFLMKNMTIMLRHSLSQRITASRTEKAESIFKEELKVPEVDVMFCKGMVRDWNSKNNISAPVAMPALAI